MSTGPSVFREDLATALQELFQQIQGLQRDQDPELYSAVALEGFELPPLAAITVTTAGGWLLAFEDGHVAELLLRDVTEEVAASSHDGMDVGGQQEADPTV